MSANALSTTLRLNLLTATALCATALCAHAQAPAGAPANASGICKDGTYSTAATKDGACRGHKGVQTWYQATKPATRAATPGPAPTPSSPASSPAAQMPGGSGQQRTQPTAATIQSTPAPARSQAPAMPAPRMDANDPTRTSAPAAATAPKPGISAERAKLSSMPAAAGGGPGLVWVNGSSKVYHCSGSEFYGKTKTGSYMSEADAKAKGAHADHNKPCS